MENTNYKFCGACGAKLKITDRFCAKCGIKIEEKSLPAENCEEILESGWKPVNQVNIPPRAKTLREERGINDASVLGMDRELVVVQPSKYNRMKILKFPFVIGKGKDADFRIIDSPTVSRKHVVIEKREGSYYLTDLQSMNHTFVDISGTKHMLNEPYRLKSDNVFYLSNEKIIISME